MNRQQRRAAAKLDAKSVQYRPGTPNVYSIALGHLQDGRWAEAEASCRTILSHRPSDPRPLHALGIVAHRQGRHLIAVELLRRAISLKPDEPEALSVLGGILKELGRLGEAAEACRHAIALQPGLASAYNNLGSIYQDQGRLDEAAGAYRHAVSLDPGFVEARLNLGLLLEVQGRPDAACGEFRSAVRANPEYPEAHRRLASAMLKLNLLDEANSILRNALAIHANHAALYSDLGIVLWKQGCLSEAVEACKQALTLNPTDAAALTNLGNILYDLGQTTEAFAAYQFAIRVDPNLPDVHFNLGSFYRSKGEGQDAIAAYRRALAIDPNHVKALAELCHQRRAICDWKGLNHDEARVLDLIRRRKGGDIPPPFLLLTNPASTPADHLAGAQAWAARYAESAESRFFRPQPFRSQQSDRRIRIGYLSADFYNHATAHLIVELVERLDRSRFEVIGYSHSPNDGSPMRGRLIGAFDGFVDINVMSHAQAAQRIRSDELDILVDLKGYTKDARTEIMAMRPAPIQVNYLGYPGTSGADFIDYIIGDPTITPMADQPFYTEKLVQLPNSYQPNDTKRWISEDVPARAECGLPEDAFVFCCFNDPYKITSEVFDVWMRLLQSLPSSVMWLLEPIYGAGENLRREAKARGVDPARLVFAKKIPLPIHLARHIHADLFLDTIPVNAHTTASDALWCGVPVVTCLGSAFIGRVAASLVKAAGLPELVTMSLQEYEDLARTLAKNPAMLAAFRQRLDRGRLSSPLFDIETYTNDMAKAFNRMVELHRSGRPPQAFVVDGEFKSLMNPTANEGAGVLRPAAGSAPVPFPRGWGAHADRHCVWIVSPERYQHHHAFDEIAEGLQSAFVELGGSAPIVRHPSKFAGRAPIVLGANLLSPADTATLPDDCIIINLEQVTRNGGWFSSDYLSILRRFAIFDYSGRNRDALARLGVDHARLFEIGYTRALTRIPQDLEKDIDVLFYGSMNERRERIINSLRALGLKVVCLFGIYGAERDNAIARSKVVINIHFYDACIFEVIRVSYLLANRVCVISEGDVFDPDIARIRGGLEIVPYERLVETCVELVADPTRREHLAQRGFDMITSFPQSHLLRKQFTG